MSVQLILYPQSYEGLFNIMASSQSEMLVNGISFSGLNSAPSYTASTNSPWVEALQSAPPTVINSWYRFSSNTATPFMPTEVSGDLFLQPNGSNIVGVYQKMDNLIQAAQYTITFTHNAASVGLFEIKFANGTNIYDTHIVPATISNPLVTYTFTALSANDTVMITLLGGGNATIPSITIQPTNLPPGAAVYLENGQVICDLYEDEDMPLTLSIDDFKNAAEKVQSYSKAFNLPGTKRNNRIFDNLFEITRSDDGLIFSPYKKTQCVLKQDGFILFEGYLRLLDVTDKEGEISYNVNLYSEVVALADFLKDREFSDLDFSELEHDYNKTEIQRSWQGILELTNNLPVGTFAGVAGTNITGVVRYPFVDWNHQWLVANGSTGSLATLGDPELTSLEQAFRPFISVKYLVDRIFEGTPFSFTSAFFDTLDFSKLYMDFNWGSDNAPVSFDSSGTANRVTSSQIITTSFATIIQNDLSIPTTVGYSSGVITAGYDNQLYFIDYNYQFSWVAPATSTLSLEWVRTTAAGTTTRDEVINQPYINGGFNYSGNFSIFLNAGDTLECKAKASISSQVFYVPQSPTDLVIVTSLNNTTNDTLLQTLRGELGQWDFLKGLLTMFNLITMPDEDNPNNIIIEPYSDIFVTPALTTPPLDWTEKVDVSEMKLDPLTDLNRSTIFKFVEDDDDYAFNVYKNSVGGKLYGSKKYPENPNNEFNILEGTDEIIAEPFAATVIKPLEDIYPDFITPAIYAYNSSDGTSEGFDNSPRIMFNNGLKILSSSTYFLPSQNNVAGGTQTQFLQFSHLSSVPTIGGTRDFNFGECQLLPGVGNSVPDNLFSLYWLPYYSELYNQNTRIMTIKVNLNPADINTFKFNSTILIKNRTFRVNKIDYKPNDLATVEFILIE